jgi:hypothetical protein
MINLGSYYNTQQNKEKGINISETFSAAPRMREILHQVHTSF